ncbi:MAG TPA: DUF4397 domain-containing protein [Candidatus Limnocylindrales bacterium]
MKLFRSIAAAAVLAAAAVMPANAADEALVRVLHASPDAPAVDVWLDGTKVDALTNVPFATISDYLSIPAGSHQVAVYATGTDSSPVIDAELEFAAGTSYTVAATDAVASIDAQVITDAPAPTADAAQVRVVHFSADAPEVDVAPDRAAPADAIVKALEYPNPTDYLTIPADSYDLEVRLAGSETVALQLDPVTVEAGKAYTVFAIGSAANPPVGEKAIQALVAVDATAEAPGESLPPTSTAAPIGDAPATSVLPALLVALAAAAAFVLSLRLRRADARR